MDIKAELKKLIEAQKQKSFVPEYRGQATDAEALGIMIAQYFQHDGVKVLKTAYAGLEDANFHTENKTILEMINKIEGGA